MDSLWEPNVSFDVSPEVLRPEAVNPEVLSPEEKPLTQNESQVPEPTAQQTPEAAESAALALSMDEFSALEDRVLRAVALVKRERIARADAEEMMNLQMTDVENLEKEVAGLKAERDHVRGRVERLLSELDALEL